jgi:AraC-like DNA-binding protein
MAWVLPKLNQILRTPVEFDAELDLVSFARDDCMRPLDTANADLARVNDEIARQYLEQLDRSSLRDRVRECLMLRLAQGELVAEDIAAALHLSLRSLQRHLADEGSSYDQMLDETRLELARSYLRGHYSISEIAYLLGYADASCFSRAFRRWTGQTPTQFRAA